MVDAVMPRVQADRPARRLAANGRVLAGALVLALLVVAAIAAPWLAPFDPFTINCISTLTLRSVGVSTTICPGVALIT